MKRKMYLNTLNLIYYIPYMFNLWEGYTCLSENTFKEMLYQIGIPSFCFPLHIFPIFLGCTAPLNPSSTLTL